MRSLRFTAAWRYSATMLAGTLLVAAIGYVALRQTLDHQIDSSLVAVASIQAASVTADSAGDMRFYEWSLTAAEVASLADLNRYAQIWDVSGASLNRSRLLAADLPLDAEALWSAAEGEMAWAGGRYGDEDVRSVYYPLSRFGESHVGHVLQVAAPLRSRNRTLRSAGLFLGSIVLLVTASSFVGSWWLGGQAVRAVGKITAQAEDIGAETLGRRITEYEGTVEYESLVHVLNTMLDRLDMSFESQRRFTADASHELRSPLTALRGELELALRRDRSSDEYRRVIESSLEEAKRLSQLTEDLLTLARSDADAIRLQRVEFDLGERVRDTVDRSRKKADAKAIDLSVTSEGDVAANADPELLDRLVWNLLDNAIKFTKPGGAVGVRIASEGDEVHLAVDDTGPGVPRELRRSIFERFSRADAAHASHEGTGLGLAISKTIVEAHGGSISVANRPEGGARFSVRLPRAIAGPSTA
jgi:two-component system OmpR family sensor kinase